MRKGILNVDCRVLTWWVRKTEDVPTHALDFLTQDMSLSVEEVIGFGHNDSRHGNTKFSLLLHQRGETVGRTELVLSSRE